MARPRTQRACAVFFFFILALFILATSLPALLAWGGVWFIVRRLPTVPRIISLVLTATLILPPSLGPATITVVPIPFGFLLVVAVFSGEWRGVIELLAMFPVWHAIAFPATATASYLIVRRLLSNKSLQQSRC